MTFKEMIGKEVFHKRSGATGTMLRADSDGYTMDFPNGIRKVTESTFKRWYVFVPEDDEEEEKETTEHNFDSHPFQEQTDARGIPIGEPGAGNECITRFVEICKEHANEQLDVEYNASNTKCTIKYNGFNVFETRIANRRLTVACHPESLSPANTLRVHTKRPDSWGWVLSSEFVFTDTGQAPLMRTIIVDGLYYRQIEK